jgi:hypothetical protein
MYLANLAAFCALTTPCVVAAAFPAQPSHLIQETQPPADAAHSTSSPQDSPAAPATERKPEPKSESSSPAPAAAPSTGPTSPESTAKKPESQKPAAQTKKSSKKRHPKPAASTPAPDSAAPEKKVVRNGGTVDPVVQLAPGMSPEQATSQRQNTSQLLAASDANLKQISSRQLNSTQQDSISQIRKYMEQAKTAEQAGDLDRARNLASKALLLSDDLVKH